MIESINWDSYNYKRRLELLKTISQFENYGWFNKNGEETQAGIELVVANWDELPEKELNIFKRWGIEK